MSKVTPRTITADMSAAGYNNEGRGKLQGYILDPNQHENYCPHRLDPRATCACRVGLWREEPNEAKPALRPYTSAERKAMPLQKFLAEYFPDAFMAVARHSLKANDKHNPGEPMHWARGKSTDHLDCAVRHLLTPDVVDVDTGEIELVGATWRCLAALQLREEARLKAAGIMPLSGVVPSP